MKIGEKNEKFYKKYDFERIFQKLKSCSGSKIRLQWDKVLCWITF
ncbi:hypothetical protein TREVI0001_2079 [Treponema vincentii ATCC 35580]|uniref:Uncharacterized protein n=1 Tax=Treponema vincentii ATCC 35580 TaxID=596324 RepID=C8PQH5_9SPIR|nr:hypothetical protein TREVI0001_2079 [Treponema vincentii ATCC 35580]